MDKTYSIQFFASGINGCQYESAQGAGIFKEINIPNEIMPAAYIVGKLSKNKLSAYTLYTGFVLL
ncbi:hypothetical protein IJT93_07275 [bacterium]|nr:hypothetical protein [bacterium]